jgi:uncharacterized protein YndB with AHSA1/START domain
MELEKTMNHVIYTKVVLNCEPHVSFLMFTENNKLASWLPKIADVEPVAGGKYELFWDPDDRENNSTIGCKVTAVEKNRFIAFQWKGPVQYEHFMNNADPLTHIVVFFIPLIIEENMKTEVHLIHSGWQSTEEWEEARQYFERNWERALENLKKIVNEL